MPDPVNDEKAPLCQTLADRLLATLITDAAPELAVLHQDKRFTTHIIDDIAPDFDKRLKELTARQTELFNADAPLQEKVLIFNEIKDIQEKRRRAQR